MIIALPVAKLLMDEMRRHGNLTRSQRSSSASDRIATLPDNVNGENKMEKIQHYPFILSEPQS